jgi:hemin uptake protein HemP
MLSDSKPKPNESVTHARSAEPVNRRIASADLFGDASIVLIQHEGATYTLRKTRNSKLLLTK